MPKVIQTKFFSQYHDNLLTSHFCINKTKKLINKKYYWPWLWKDIKTYVKGCDVCLAFKTIKYKLYKDLQALPIPIH